MRWLCVLLAVGKIVLGRRGAAQSQERVAVVMAGHARTYNLTAESWRRMLVLANPRCEFWIFALSYDTGERKAALRSSVKAEPLTKTVTPDILRETYGPVVGSAKRVVVKVISESVAERKLPSRLRGGRRRRILFKTHDKQRKRLSLMFTMVAEAFGMVRHAERRWKRRFDYVVKSRFDLELLANFVLAPDKLSMPTTKKQQKAMTPVVVPLEMASGPSHLSPKQIRTRPCDEGGRQTPHWVQDHIAWGTSRAMEFYCNGTARAVLAGTQKRETRPELILAKALKARGIAVKCDPSIRYTILR
mmetsp:Transcript_15847/g.51720  ORF Transcript_15847/g.51720 Transcript_15847/m.51720 type:complete len:303 (-) Transcript_15847:56-964(-)